MRRIYIEIELHECDDLDSETIREDIYNTLNEYSRFVLWDEIKAVKIGAPE